MAAESGSGVADFGSDPPPAQNQNQGQPPPPPPQQGPLQTAPAQNHNKNQNHPPLPQQQNPPPQNSLAQMTLLVNEMSKMLVSAGLPVPNFTGGYGAGTGANVQQQNNTTGFTNVNSTNTTGLVDPNTYPIASVNAVIQQGGKSKFAPVTTTEASDTDSDLGGQNVRRRKKTKRRTQDREQEMQAGYECNQKLAEKVASNLPIKPFEFGSSESDWSVWIRRYEAAIFSTANPHTKERHGQFNLKWLPMYLNDAAFPIWERCHYKYSNWDKLKKELAEAYEDPAIRASWKTDMKAYQWTEGTSLQTYYANVIRYVEKYDTELVSCQEALTKNYYIRFINGLPEDYLNHVDSSLAEDKETIERAYKVARKFERVKARKVKLKNTIRPEVGAAAYQDDTMQFRLESLEDQVSRINKKIDSLLAEDLNDSDYSNDS